MATTIKLKNGSGAPLAGDLVAAEPAFDLTNKRLYTEDSGGTVIEVGTNPGTDVTFADNRKAIFGAGSDLQIYHDGSHSRIDEQGTGVLFLQTNGTNIQLNKGTSENMLVANVDGSVDLYYDGSQKLATTATGIDVTGDVNSDSVTTGTFTSTGIDDNATSTAITIDSSENVGIGTASPASPLTVVAATGGGAVDIFGRASDGLGWLTYKTNNGASSHAFIGTPATNSLAFYTNGFTERMRIDSSGLVGINTTNPATFLEVAHATTGVANNITTYNSNTAASAECAVDWSLERTGSAIKQRAARITAGKEQTWTTTPSTVDGYLKFLTVRDESLNEAMRIDSSGNLRVGTATHELASNRRATFLGTAGIEAVATGTTAEPCIDAWQKHTSGDNVFLYFYTETSHTQRGSITYNRTGGLVAYNTTSDYRAKNITGPLEDAGSTIDALKVYTGKMKDASVERPMLIAHEAQEVVPYAVTGEKDAVKEDGTPKYQQIDVSSLVPLLIAEIQDLRARVAQLEGA
jgi:hypothetical protein